MRFAGLRSLRNNMRRRSRVAVILSESKTRKSRVPMYVRARYSFRVGECETSKKSSAPEYSLKRRWRRRVCLAAAGTERLVIPVPGHVSVGLNTYVASCGRLNCSFSVLYRTNRSHELATIKSEKSCASPHPSCFL